MTTRLSPTTRFAVVAMGGVGGALLRAGISELVPYDAGHFPTSLLLTQAIGCGLAGFRQRRCVSVTSPLPPGFTASAGPPKPAIATTTWSVANEGTFTTEDRGVLNEVRRHAVPAPGEILRAQPVPPNALMTRRLWERVGGYDESATMRIGREDWEFYIRAFTAGGCHPSGRRSAR